MGLDYTECAEHATHELGVYKIFSACNRASGKEHAVILMGNVSGQRVPVRISSLCVTGMVLHSATCDCREQLDLAFGTIHRAGSGIIILLDQEGRGHGLATKIRALRLKNEGFNTFEAVERLGLRADVRNYSDAVDILNYLGIRKVELLTGNPDKVEALRCADIIVEKISPLLVPVHPRIACHLEAKRRRGFLFEPS